MARKGAPRKRGLAYFRMDVDFFEDDRIQDCIFDFGPVAAAVYLAILCIVYSNGSHARMDREKLIRAVKLKVGHDYFARQQRMQREGGKRKKDTVADVIDRFAEIGLIDRECLGAGIVTSREMQRRHRDASALTHRCLDSADYWLLEDSENEEDAEALIKSSLNGFSSEEIRLSSEENTEMSEESTPKRKENKRKEGAITLSYPSIHQGQAGSRTEDGRDGRITPPTGKHIDDKTRLVLGDAVQRIRERIDYDALLAEHGSAKGTIDAILSILLEVELAKASEMTISGVRYPMELVKARLASVDSGHIEYILGAMECVSGGIRNMKQYLLAALYNAACTLEASCEAEVRRDMPWLKQG